MYPIEDPIVYRVTHVSRQVSVCARVARQRDGERPPSKRHHRRLPDRTPTAGVRVADIYGWMDIYIEISASDQRSTNSLTKDLTRQHHRHGSCGANSTGFDLFCTPYLNGVLRFSVQGTGEAHSGALSRLGDCATATPCNRASELHLRYSAAEYRSRTSNGHAIHLRPPMTTCQAPRWHKDQLESGRAHRTTRVL
jgi:hypothetical protein